VGVSEPSVSVVLLSHSRPQMVGQALASIVGQSLRDREIIVVDNRSDASDEIARIVAAFPEARLVQAETNLGFTAGMNVGLRRATGRYVFLTEDDIVAEPDCLELLRAHAETHPQTGLLTGLLLHESDGTVVCAGGEVALGPPYRLRMIGAGERDRGQFLEPFDVTYVPCGAALAPRELLLRLGGFRDDMFLYFEDVDLCLRVAKRGYRIIVVPRARLSHLGSPIDRVPEWIEFHKAKNFFSLYLLHAPARSLPSVALRYGVLNMAEALVHDRRRFMRLVRAWWWVLVHLRQLLVDRWKR
jgi:N-acetylglucosaminyl-diphospho-decaprenol L-rhamnosyltransferase